MLRGQGQQWDLFLQLLYPYGLCLFDHRFLRDLRVLKTYANYSTCDPNNLADWLADVDPRFRQYTYGLVQSGVDRRHILHVTDEQLRTDCAVENGVHRAKILAAMRHPKKACLTDAQPCGPDVFISYRRTTGSQLARSEDDQTCFSFLSAMAIHTGSLCHT